MSKTKKPKTAKAGDEITARAASHMRATWPRMFDLLLSTKEGCTVQAKSNVQNGQWACIDCGEMFQNNMSAWGHSATHRRVWWTGERFEEP